MTSDRKDLIIFSNGPGEISTWVMPVVEALRKRKGFAGRYRIILIIHPCPFGSGTESMVGTHIEGLEHFIGSGEYMKMLLTGFGKKRYGFSREGIIFSLGGDLMHPVLFRRRIKGRHLLYAYSHNTGWEKHYEKIFVRNEYVKNKYLKRGVQEERIMVTGDLVYSSLKYRRDRETVRRELGVKERERLVAFLPGPRDYMTRYVLPVFLKVIDDLDERVQGMKACVMKSPYISCELIEEGLRLGGTIREVESIPGTLLRDDERCRIRFSSDKTVDVLEGQLEQWGSGIDLAVSLPGTNTIELAYRRVPTLVIAAANKPEIVPMEGPIGMVKWIPLLGKALTRLAVYSYARRYPYTALPSIYTNQEIFPELHGIITTDDITNRLVEMLEGDELERIGERLDIFQLPHNPVDLIVRCVLNLDKTSQSV
jgi:lipid-A-disaccharide synthase